MTLHLRNFLVLDLGLDIVWSNFFVLDVLDLDLDNLLRNFLVLHLGLDNVLLSWTLAMTLYLKNFLVLNLGLDNVLTNFVVLDLGHDIVFKNLPCPESWP